MVVAVLAGCRPEGRSKSMDLRLRGQVDAHNKAAFVNRYQDPSCSICEAREALKLMRDSLPNYADGRLRAYNNLAFGYYMLAEQDSAAAYADSVLASGAKSANADVERLIAQLMEIRLLQRSCHIADSYRLLYGIDRSAAFRRNRDSYLYNYAQMEYYITSLTLNYHYRNNAVASSSGTQLDADTKEAMRELLADIEEERSGLKCDYNEDMSLNYALAHSCYRLAAASGSDPELLAKAYGYLAENVRILAIPGQYCSYHLANVFQLQAFILADTNILLEACVQHCCRELNALDSLIDRHFPLDTAALSADYGLDLFRISTDLFFQTSDPYQHLGAVVAAAEYCQRVGALEEARRYYDAILADTTWHDGMAPKFESMLYDGLIRTGYSNDPQTTMQWYSHEMQLLTHIRENERADVMLQDRLFHSENRNRYYLAAIAIGLLFLVILSVLVVLLHRRSNVLRTEKLALLEAKRQDVERIANVETCLSVLRHDINPFLSYLASKNLSDEMRREVLDQLLRTFSNIKTWTNLSIPSGLQFQPSHFALGEVFESVSASCVRLNAEVRLDFRPTPLRLWGDRQLVEILLRNLVNNALQHTARGTVVVSAEPCADDPRFVHLQVSDTGCGMDAETLDGLFRADKPVRPDPAGGASHGTGFGLILCKYIIKRHDDNTLRGCRIWAESLPGQGSTFHCLLAAPANGEQPSSASA